MTAWTDLSEAEQNTVWDAFYSRFSFRPSVDPKNWPSFSVPSPFITWRVPDPWSGPAMEDLARNALSAFRMALPGDQRMLALDWQHACFWFRPHLQEEASPWKIPVLPDGDYGFFLAESLEWGWLGHPWEGTVTVFGTPLLAALKENPPTLFQQVLREG